jgi:hypothetical protein
LTIPFGAAPMCVRALPMGGRIIMASTHTERDLIALLELRAKCR